MHYIRHLGNGWARHGIGLVIQFIDQFGLLPVQGFQGFMQACLGQPRLCERKMQPQQLIAGCGGAAGRSIKQHQKNIPGFAAGWRLLESQNIFTCCLVVPGQFKKVIDHVRGMRQVIKGHPQRIPFCCG